MACDRSAAFEFLYSSLLTLATKPKIFWQSERLLVKLQKIYTTNKASQIKTGPRVYDYTQAGSFNRVTPSAAYLSISSSSPSMKPASLRLRTGCCSLRMALASTWRTRSRVTLKIRPTSSRV